jgi:formylglycine-generating enzyme required for sulfatase activity/tRNA A-37 threonylcarbamoyl transferase component Bud32
MSPEPDHLRLVDPREGDELARASLIGRYIVLERLSAGAMGVVYEAYDPSLDRKVALKLLRTSRERASGPEAAARQEKRLLAEAKAVARLSHANVVAIHDVGSHRGRVFLTMELLRGGTLRAWMEGPRRSRAEILDMFIRIGHGLVAAHAAGVVHRDFKPDNVLLGGDGVPKVADFGLAHLLNGAAEEGPPSGANGASVAVGANGVAAGGAGPAAPPALTATGALVGTPAYMAPEQFLGRPPGPHSDQFAFTVALYEALYGERPFAGATWLELAAATVSGESRTPPPGARTPAWLQRLIARGLSARPSDRFASLRELVAVLESHARPPLRRRLTMLLAIGAGMALAAGSLTYVGSKRRAFEQTVASRLLEGRAALQEAERGACEMEALRPRMVAQFGGGDVAEGEASWRRLQEMRAAVHANHSRAEQAGESTLLMDPARGEARALVADALLGRLLVDLDARGEPDADLAARLALYDQGGLRRWRFASDAHVTIQPQPQPVGARIDVDRFVRAAGEAGSYQAVARGLAAPLVDHALPPGSYLFTLSAPGAAALRLAVVLRAGARERLSPGVRAESSLPPDFALVSAGEFLVGSALEDEFRRDLFRTVPLHRAQGHTFLIKRHETTFGEWIDYLEALPPVERARRTPRAASVGAQGDLELRRLSPGRWSLRLQPSTRGHVVRTGELLRDEGRRGFEAQDWMRLPVSAVSLEDAVSYAAWLRGSGRVPGARLCTNEEWEQAARGADGRPYPHGWRLAPGDANHQGTWNHDMRRYGPVVVGSFPRSDSPYGVSDMAGNVWEWVRTAGARPGQSVRGGAFAFDLVALRSDVREQAEAPMRDITIGVRICADP